VFYVGKGVNDRVFSHLADTSESDKVRRINEIRSIGLEPKIEILIHGIDSDDEIRKIEASIIDLIGLDRLTNRNSGYGSKEFGRMSIDQIISLYESEEIEITEKAILININKTYHYGISEIELYDATRSAWVLGIDREKAEYAFAVYEGIVKEVYLIKAWFPDNSTFNVRKFEIEDVREERWEFIGKLAEKNIREKYINKDVSKYLGPRNPINYVNIKEKDT